MFIVVFNEDMEKQRTMGARRKIRQNNFVVFSSFRLVPSEDKVRYGTNQPP
jgi:hypothetical protein